MAAKFWLRAGETVWLRGIPFILVRRALLEGEPENMELVGVSFDDVEEEPPTSMANR